MFLFVAASLLVLESFTAEDVADAFLVTLPSLLSLERMSGVLYIGWFMVLIVKGLLGFAYAKSPLQRTRKLLLVH